MSATKSQRHENAYAVVGTHTGSRTRAGRQQTKKGEPCAATPIPGRAGGSPSLAARTPGPPSARRLSLPCLPCPHLPWFQSQSSACVCTCTYACILTKMHLCVHMFSANTFTSSARTHAHTPTHTYTLALDLIVCAKRASRAQQRTAFNDSKTPPCTHAGTHAKNMRVYIMVFARMHVRMQACMDVHTVHTC